MALSKQLQRIHEAIMTIKQYGGVFGRNPTFNDVTIEGQLTFDGDIDINSDLKVSGDIETTGNVIIATSGKGIDFSATAGTGTSELLDDYEEGTWTPAAWYQNSTDQAAVTNVTQTGTYTKVGNLVTVHCYLTWTISTTPVNDNVGVKNLPFTQTSQLACAAAIVGNAATNPATTWTVVGIGPSAPYAYLSDGVDSSNKADEVGGTGTKTLRFTLTYEAA
jgi:hypothetical protein